MLSGRMLRILEYLKDHPQSTYKGVAEALEIKERNVRYDLDKINDFLVTNHAPVINKKSKGVISIPEDFDFSIINQEKDFVYSLEERLSLIWFVLLINSESLKLGEMSDMLQVSRSTIKNDIHLLENKIIENDIYISYSDHFYLDVDHHRLLTLMNYEFKKYVYILKQDKKRLTPFEKSIVKILKKTYGTISLDEVINWCNDCIEQVGYLLNDDFYRWFVANILVFIWCIMRNKEISLEQETSIVKNIQYSECLKRLEIIIGQPIQDDQKVEFIRLLNCLDNNIRNDELDFAYVEKTVFQLIHEMSKEMNIDFSKDNILIEGLFNHIIPLLKRVQIQDGLGHEVFSILSEKDREVFHIVLKVIKRIDVLKYIDSYDEITYLVIHFLASMKRLSQQTKQRVVLVCNHGYASTMMLKELLTSEYEVYVVDTLPIYKLDSYTKWSEVDCIISTIPLNYTFHKKYIVIHPIFANDDYQKLDELGLKRKKRKPELYDLYKKMDFLEEKDKNRVLSLIKDEFGYENVKIPQSVDRMSQYIYLDCIQIIEHAQPWRDIVRLSTELLLRQNFVNKGYDQEIIETYENVGFYSVIDDWFALLHGKSRKDIQKTCMSIIVSKEDILFGDKKVKIVFCLACKNEKEHIPAMALLVKMIKRCHLLEKIQHAQNPQEIFDAFYHCEMEVAFL